jgi:hypothetical protein
LDSEPAIISVAGMNSKHLSEAVNQFIQKIVVAAGRHAKTRFGRHHFWLPLSAGPKQTTKNNQYITPPVLAIEEFGLDTMRELFTGQELAGLAEQMIPEAVAWATRKEENGQSQEPAAAMSDPAYDDTEDEIPF